MNETKFSGLLYNPNYEVNNAPNHGIIIGNRIPREYFITKGRGESDIAIHAGSYHIALKSAGIEMANIITYSSILPAIAKQVPKPYKLTHGCVMESIMAVANGCKGERISAGISYGWLFDRNSNKKYGGLVCEHNGPFSLKEIKLKLRASLDEIFYNGYEEDFYLQDVYTITDSFVPRKNFGTVLVSLCFTNYYYPILE